MSLDIFHFEDGKQSFEDCAKENGVTHWDEELLRESLGYGTDDGFAKAINRAKKACLSLGIACEDHIIRQADGKHYLTRFGCFLVSMNGDPKKPEVAKAQAYFATIAETFQTHLECADAMDRVLIREEVTDGQKSLVGVAKAHGIKEYAFFQNKGYMGMYNMSLDRLKHYKGVPADKNLIDHMGKTELAAHLFRITQTAEKIQNENIRGQVPLENAALAVGKMVRKSMIEIGGKAPEDLAPAENINTAKSKIKGASRKLKDNRKKKA